MQNKYVPLIMQNKYTPLILIIVLPCIALLIAITLLAMIGPVFAALGNGIHSNYTNPEMPSIPHKPTPAPGHKSSGKLSVPRIAWSNQENADPVPLACCPNTNYHTG